MAMDLIDTMLIHVAVYWAPIGSDEKGRQKFAAPVEILARWDTALKRILDVKDKSDLTAFMSKVYVAQDVQDLGVLWKSTASPDDPPGTALAQLTNANNPFANTNAAEIRKFTSLDTLDGEQSLRIAYL